MKKHAALTDPDAAAVWINLVHVYTPNYSYQSVALTRNWHNADGKPRCRHAVHETFGVGFHQCTKAGHEQTADPDRMWWCKIHGPTGRDAREAKREAKWRAEEDAHAAAELRRTNTNPYVRALREIAAGHNDPRSLAVEVLGSLLTTPLDLDPN